MSAISSSIQPEITKEPAEAETTARHLQPIRSSVLAVAAVQTVATSQIRQADRLRQAVLDPRDEYAPAENLGMQTGQSNVFKLHRARRTEPIDHQQARLHANIKTMTQSIGSAFIEAELGIRPFAQLGSWLEFELFHKLKARVHHLAREKHHAARAGEEASRKIPSITPIGVRAARRPSGEWESSMTIRVGDRARAIAMRLQLHRDRWRVIALEVG